MKEWAYSWSVAPHIVLMVFIVLREEMLQTIQKKSVPLTQPLLFSTPSCWPHWVHIGSRGTIFLLKKLHTWVSLPEVSCFFVYI